MQIDLAGTVAWELPRSSRPQPSQPELIREIAQGNTRAMQILFVQHRLRVYRFALRLVDDEQAAEDLVSEVFLEVWRHAGRFEGRCRVSTWLLAITRNLALSMLRRRWKDWTTMRPRQFQIMPTIPRWRSRGGSRVRFLRTA